MVKNLPMGQAFDEVGGPKVPKEGAGGAEPAHFPTRTWLGSESVRVGVWGSICNPKIPKHCGFQSKREISQV